MLTYLRYALATFCFAAVGDRPEDTPRNSASLCKSPDLRDAVLIFAFAGVAALRLGRRFTIRSAIIATTVVAALLGMAVTL